MKRILDRTDIVFTPGAAGVGTIVFRGESPTFESVQLVTNLTRGVVIYQFNSTTKGSAGYNERTYTLTLDLDTSTHSATDVLQVIVEEAVDPSKALPTVGVDPRGYDRRFAVTEDGHSIIADGRVFTAGRTSLGTLFTIDTQGFQSIVAQVSGTFSATVAFEASNDLSNWSPINGWWLSQAANTPVNQVTTAGTFAFAAGARYFRARVSAYTSGVPTVVAVLRSMNAFLPYSTQSINVAQVNALALTAEDSAAISTPVIVGGVARTSLPASTMTHLDSIRATYSTSGQGIVKDFAPVDLDWFVSTTVTTATQTAIRAAQGLQVRQSITSIVYQNTNATATTLLIQDGSTTLLSISVPASMSEPRQLNFPTPLRSTANTALNYTAGTTGANVLLNVTGFNSY